MTAISSVSQEGNVGSPSQCVVLVPTFSHIEPACEQGLSELEKLGYVVRRQYGFSQIDFGRNVMASAALRDGFEQLMWIDADIGFQPDFVNQLRQHRLPLVTGVYTKKGPRALACEVLAETKQIVFGEGGRIGSNSLCPRRVLAHTSSSLRDDPTEVCSTTLQPTTASTATMFDFTRHSFAVADLVLTL